MATSGYVRSKKINPNVIRMARNTYGNPSKGQLDDMNQLYTNPRNFASAVTEALRSKPGQPTGRYGSSRFKK